LLQSSGRILRFGNNFIYKLTILFELTKYWLICVLFKVYTRLKGNSSKSLEMDDDLDDQHRAAEHHDNFQSSGEDEMSDWFFGADAATLSKIVQWGW
jgi:hypothetical protein